jgi:hypothetical protein
MDGVITDSRQSGVRPTAPASTYQRLCKVDPSDQLRGLASCNMLNNLYLNPIPWIRSATTHRVVIWDDRTNKGFRMDAFGHLL